MPKAKLFLYDSSSQTPAATAAYLNKAMQRNGGSSRLDIDTLHPPSADGGRYATKRMKYKALHLGINLYALAGSLRENDFALGAATTATLDGLFSAFSFTKSPCDLKTASEVGDFAVGVIPRLNAQFDVETSSAFAIGYFLPSLGPGPYPEGIIETVRKFWKNLRFSEVELQRFLTAASPERAQIINSISEKFESTGSTNNRVFVIHGHDDGMKEAVARTISKLGLTPVILHEQADGGRTIIEKFEHNSDVGFAVVLLSPDDIGYSKSSSPKQAQPRARQNVIMEMGYFMAKLGRQKVAVLRRHDVEVPSDITGVVYTAFDDGGSWRFTIARELKESGFAIDTNELLKA